MDFQLSIINPGRAVLADWYILPYIVFRLLEGNLWIGLIDTFLVIVPGSRSNACALATTHPPEQVFSRSILSPQAAVFVLDQTRRHGLFLVLLRSF